MNWEAVGTIIALLGVMVTFLFNVQRLRQERRMAQASAERSEAAARLIESYSRRVVEALETIAEGGAVLHSAAAAEARWRLEAERGGVYRLTNEGPAAAEDVTLVADPSLPIDAPPARRLEPGEALTFGASPSPLTRDMTVEVFWSRPGDARRRTWRYPLPPPPDRGDRL